MESVDKLERTLANLKEANHAPEVGHGSQPKDLVLVGHFYDRRNCLKFIGKLSSNGIEVSRKYVGLKVEVLVHKQHLSSALDELADHRRLHSDCRPKDISRIYDAPALIAGIGVLTAAFQVFILQLPILGLAVLLTCFSCAWWLFRYRRAALLHGRQFSILEVLAITCCVGVLSALWRYALL